MPVIVFLYYTSNCTIFKQMVKLHGFMQCLLWITHPAEDWTFVGGYLYIFSHHPRIIPLIVARIPWY